MGKPNLQYYPPRKVYMCGNDWAEEPAAVAYESIEDLKENKKCWKECGIVELDVTGVRFVA